MAWFLIHEWVTSPLPAAAAARGDKASAYVLIDQKGDMYLQCGLFSGKEFPWKP
jgi:hypothetical protein